MYVCICFAVTDETIHAAVAGGAASVAEVTRMCRAGGDCGACRGAIADIVEEGTEDDDGRIHLPISAGRAA